MNSISGDGRVERQHQAEKPKQQPKTHPCAAFQKPADPDRDKKRADEHDYRDHVPLCFGQRVKHQVASIPESTSLKQALSQLGSRVLAPNRFASLHRRGSSRAETPRWIEQSPARYEIIAAK